jgi:hypothetical protein
MMMSVKISFPNLRSPESVGAIRKSGGAISASALAAEISRRFGVPQMAGRARRSDHSALGAATNGFRNLRSPESVGAIRKSGGAISARALAAEISRRFGVPQMAGRARRSDHSALGTATNGFWNLRSPESVGEIRKSGGAKSARALGAEIAHRFGAPQMAGRARRSDHSALGTATNGFRNLRSPESVGEIRKSGGAKSARALAAEIAHRFGAPQMAGRANIPT